MRTSVTLEKLAEYEHSDVDPLTDPA